MDIHERKRAFVKDGRRLKFGVFIAQVFPWQDMVKHSLFVESLGFDSLWVADHFVNPYQPEVDWFDGWTLLSGIAAKTSRIRVGTLVTHIVYHNPAVLARQAMTLDHIANGRVELGIGSGGSRYCHEMTGVPLWGPRERTGRFIEAVELIDALLRQEVTSYEGAYYRVSDAQMHPPPVQQPRPPLVVAAHGPITLKLAAKYADGWSHYWPGRDLSPSEALDVVRVRNNRLSELAEKYDREPGTIKRSQAVGYTAESPLASIDAFRDFVGRYTEIGMNEFVIGYVPGLEQFEGKFATKPDQLEGIAAHYLTKA